jgi:hypothetical protein
LEILVSHLGLRLRTVKHLSKTRWPTHADAVKSLSDGYEEIKKGLDALLNDIHQSAETHLIVRGLRTKLDQLETTFFNCSLE